MSDVPGPRGRKPILDAGRIVDAAVAVLDAEGLPAVTFRRVARELGVSHMTLYGYFESKDALLEALVARTIALPAREPDADAPWDATLLAVLGDIHTALAHRPGIAELLVAREFTGEWVAQAREALLAVLRSGGFDERQATDGLSVIFNYVLGAVLIETSRGRGGSASSFDLGLRYLVDGLRRDPP